MKRTVFSLLAAFALCVSAAAAGPAVSCPSALLMEKQTGTVLFAQDEHTPREPASVTKIMTLLLVMEAIDSGALSYDDVVTGSAFLVVAFEAATLVSCGAFAAIADFVISPGGNVVGLDPNLTLFGVAAAGYGAFNLIFLPGFYRTGYKSGLPTLFGVLGYLALYGVAETLVQAIPSLTAALDGLNAEYLWARAIALAVGLLLMGALTAIGVKLGQKKFDKISL